MCSERAKTPEQSGKPPVPNRFICVHGHFYQPPRENPWLEAVELQESAAPYHDWNDRITAECYAPNGAARITNEQNEIVRIVNNYSRTSFNFGPTLLKWLAEQAPRTYRMVIEADKASEHRYNGHGSALAQVYNHMILPLANRRDSLTQIRWGIADFVYRFGRRPEGMWLAETAVNRATLDLLASEGIKFTILAPAQCARIRPRGSEDWNWTPTANASVDTRHPYLVNLDEGRSIAVFFYDGPTSRAIAFEGLLNSGEGFAHRLLHGLAPGSDTKPQLSHVATDGESYGHHHRYGEMALAYALHWIEESDAARLTNYGEFLANFPPEWEADVVEDTSWSCAHGIERWRSDCGCSGGRAGCNQAWRGPLREALDMLRDQTAPLAQAFATAFFKDLWGARDAYIDVMLDRSQTNVDSFFARYGARDLSPAERIAALELMELERHTQLMYTSCGWFFDEVSGIETVQIIAYAGRVLQLAAKLFGEAGALLEPRFLEILARAKSNIPEVGDAAELYRKYVLGVRVDLKQVAAHYAISSIFRIYPDDSELFCFDVHRTAYESLSSGRGKVAMGRANIRSRITGDSEDLCFAVLHLGDQNLSAAVRTLRADNAEDIAGFNEFATKVRSSVNHANLPEVIRSIDRYFGAQAYSLNSLFSDEQHRILRTILDRTVAEMEDSLRKIYEDHTSLLRFLTASGMAAPPALALATNYAINSSLRRAIDAEPFDANQIHDLLARAIADQVVLDAANISFVAGQRMKRAMVQLEAAIESDRAMKGALQTALTVATTLRDLPFDVNLWQSQNIWNDLSRRSDSQYWSPEMKEPFKKLGEALYISVDDLVTEEGVPAF